MTTSQDRGMKKKVEEHPVVFFLGSIATGFLAGFGAHIAIERVANLENVPRGSFVTKEAVTQNYIERAIVNRDFTSNETVSKEYVLTKDRCATCSGEMSPCLQAAQKAGRPYALNNVTMIDTIIGAKGETYAVDRRTIYVATALRDIDGSQDFREEYTSSAAQLVEWRGPQVEDRTGNPGIYQVRVKAVQGEMFTVVTGIRFNHPQKPDGRTSFIGMPIPRGVDYSIYPNTEDWICDIQIVVQSTNRRVRPYSEGAYRATKDGTRHEGLIVGESTNSQSEDVARSISGRWRNVAPGTRVGVLFQFP